MANLTEAKAGHGEDLLRISADGRWLDIRPDSASTQIQIHLMPCAVNNIIIKDALGDVIHELCVADIGKTTDG